MRTVVIIHGSYGSPDENWFPWLKLQAELTGHRTVVPTFPTPKGQSLDSWREVSNRAVGPLTGDHLLVGHSLGVAFILDLLERSPVAVRASFLVSGFIGELGNPEFDQVNETFVSRKFIWPKIRANMGHAFIYHGRNDPYVSISKCKELADKLNVTPVIVENGGHLNSSSGYVSFDLLWSQLKPLLNSD
jgi:predicted alpha/beta hydrolase family esterase